VPAECRVRHRGGSGSPKVISANTAGSKNWIAIRAMEGFPALKLPACADFRHLRRHTGKGGTFNLV